MLYIYSCIASALQLILFKRLWPYFNKYYFGLKPLQMIQVVVQNEFQYKLKSTFHVKYQFQNIKCCMFFTEQNGTSNCIEMESVSNNVPLLF